MFKWFWNFLSALYAYDTVYVMQFRKELKDIAKRIRRHGYSHPGVYINREQAYAEIRTLCGFGRLVALIKVHGSESTPFRAIVRSVTPLPTQVQAEFTKAMPSLQVLFEVCT